MQVIDRPGILTGFLQKYLISSQVFVPLYLGMVSYPKTLVLQDMLARERAKNTIPDILLLLQHPRVFTTGRFRGEDDLLISPEQLSQEGFALVRTNRGGSITCHGPGQLIGYPVMNLRQHGMGIKDFVRTLETVIIQVLRLAGLEAGRLPNYPGIWVDEAKICSIGIHVGHGVTTHGFALNVMNDLRPFELINPCGLKNIRMTSISQELGCSVKCEDIVPHIMDSFSHIFAIKAGV